MPRPGSDLARLATAWLGRSIDSVDPTSDGRPDLPGPDLDDLTGDARTYGFHATLKPPFRLAEGVTADDATAEVAALAARCVPAAIGELSVDTLSGFVAMRPSAPVPALDDLAAACVRELDPLRRPPDELELARRRRASLSRRQDELLVRWGYPYVLDQFRYHMTLTRRLSDDETDDVLAAAREWFAPVDGAPFAVEDLCVVEQSAPGEPFVLRSRHPVGSGRIHHDDQQ